MDDCPEGTSDNSPAFQRREERPEVLSPEGTAEIMGPMSRSQPRQERPHFQARKVRGASEASRSNIGIETCEGDASARCFRRITSVSRATAFSVFLPLF
jgi:hypothetical protein